MGMLILIVSLFALMGFVMYWFDLRRPPVSNMRSGMVEDLDRTREIRNEIADESIRDMKNKELVKKENEKVKQKEKDPFDL